MASTNPQPDDGAGPPLLPFSGIDRASAFDLPYAVDPAAHADLPPPPDPPAPPESPVAPGGQAPPVASPAVARQTAPAEATPEPGLRGPRPFLPPNFSKPGAAAPPRQAPTGPERAPAASAPAAMPPPLSAQPLSGPVVPVGDDAPDRVDPEPAAAALPPMVAARTFEAPAVVADAPLGTDAAPPTPPAATKPPTGRIAPPPILSRRRTSEAPTPAPPPQPTTGTADPGPVPVGPLTMSPDAPLPPAPSGPLTMSPEAPVPVAPPPPPAPTGSSIPPLVPGAPAPPAAALGADPAGTGPRVADGLLVGLAAAAVAGAVWWAVVALTQRQFPYLAVLLGLLVGQGVLVGARRGSLALGALAGVLTLVGLSVAQYFISRSLAISELGLDVPLWEGAGRAVDVIRATYQDDALTLVFVVLAAGCAAFAAGRASARPVT